MPRPKTKICRVCKEPSVGILCKVCYNTKNNKIAGRYKGGLDRFGSTYINIDTVNIFTSKD